MDALVVNTSWAKDRKQTWVDLFDRLSTYTDPTEVSFSEIEQVMGKSTDENSQVVVTSRKRGFRKDAPKQRLQGRSIKRAEELTELDKAISDIEELSDTSSMGSLSDAFDSSDYDSESVDSVLYVLHCNEQRKLPGFNAKVENCQTFLSQSGESREDIYAQRTFLNTYEFSEKPSLNTSRKQSKSMLHRNASRKSFCASKNLTCSSGVCSEIESVSDTCLINEEPPILANRTASSKNVNSNCELFDVNKARSPSIDTPSKDTDDKENRSPLENCSGMEPNVNTQNGKKKLRKKFRMKMFSSEMYPWNALSSVFNVPAAETTTKKMLISSAPNVNVDESAKRADAEIEKITGLFSNADSTIRNEDTWNDMSGGGEKRNELNLSDEDDLVGTIFDMSNASKRMCNTNEKKFNGSLLSGVKTSSKQRETQTLIVHGERASYRMLPMSDESTIVNEPQSSKAKTSGKNPKLKMRENTDKSPTVSIALDAASSTKRNKFSRCRQRLFTSFSENGSKEVKSSIKKGDLVNVDGDGSEDSKWPNKAHLLVEQSKKRKLEDSNSGPVKPTKKKRDTTTGAKPVPARKSITSKQILKLEPIQKAVAVNEVQTVVETEVKNDGINGHKKVGNTILPERTKQPEVALNVTEDGSMSNEETENRAKQPSPEQVKGKRRRCKRPMRFQQFTSEEPTIGMDYRRISTMQHRIPLSFAFFLNDEE